MSDRFAAVMLFSVMVASVSQVLLKKGASLHYASIIREYINPYVIGGYGMLFCSMLLTVYAYSGMDYKNGPVIESLGNVFVPALSAIVFKEKISIRKIAGIACIMAGIVIFNI